MNLRIQELAEQCVGSRPYNTFDYEKFAELIVQECLDQCYYRGMNERIRELAEQCWDRRLDGLHFDREQFAELIVRECAGVAQNKDDTDINLRLARGLAAFKILEHFGVEP